MTVRLYSTEDLSKVVAKLQRLNVTKLSIASIEGELQDAERGLTTDAPETATQENSLQFYLGADTDGQDDSGFTWICKCNIARHVISRCSFCGTYRPKITDEPDDLDPSPTPPVIQRP